MMPWRASVLQSHYEPPNWHTHCTVFEIWYEIHDYSKISTQESTANEDQKHIQLRASSFTFNLSMHRIDLQFAPFPEPDPLFMNTCCSAADDTDCSRDGVGNNWSDQPSSSTSLIRWGNLSVWRHYATLRYVISGDEPQQWLYTHADVTRIVLSLSTDTGYTLLPHPIYFNEQ